MGNVKGWKLAIAAVGLSVALPAVVVAFGNCNNSVEVQASAKMVVITPIAISRLRSLDFGMVIPDRPWGQVTCTPQGRVKKVKGLTQIGGCRSGLFEVSGEPGLTYSISLPSSPIELTSPGGGGSGKVFAQRFKSKPKNNGRIGHGGSSQLKVGATIRVRGDTPGGHYTGVYTVTVNYN